MKKDKINQIFKDAFNLFLIEIKKELWWLKEIY